MSWLKTLTYHTVFKMRMTLWRESFGEDQLCHLVPDCVKDNSYQAVWSTGQQTHPLVSHLLYFQGMYVMYI